MPSVSRNEEHESLISDLDEILIALVVGNLDMQGRKTGSNNEPSSARYSPLNGDWEGLCPILFDASATEALLDDTIYAAKKAFESGVEVKLHIEQFMCHVYPVFVNTFPEAQYSVVRASQFILEHLK